MVAVIQMSQFEITIVILTVLTAILVPMAALVLRVVIKATKRDDQIEQLVADVKELVSTSQDAEKENADAMKTVVKEQGRIHSEIYEQMRVDRDATDKRLRFLEEYWMKRGQG
jgi:biopolymer transport protein ExbB/TolQ